MHMTVYAGSLNANDLLLIPRTWRYGDELKRELLSESSLLCARFCFSCLIFPSEDACTLMRSLRLDAAINLANSSRHVDFDQRAFRPAVQA